MYQNLLKIYPSFVKIVSRLYIKGEKNYRTEE